MYLVLFIAIIGILFQDGSLGNTIYNRNPGQKKKGCSIDPELPPDTVIKMAGQRFWRADTHRIQLDTLKLNIDDSNNKTFRSKRLFGNTTLNVSDLSPTHASMIKLFDIYYPYLRVDDSIYKHWAKKERKEVTQFLNDILNTKVMKILNEILNDHGYLSTDCTLKDRLQLIWFQRYSRSPRYTAEDSSGFEHTFVGECRKNQTIGLHNWIRIYQMEQANDKNVFKFKKVLRHRSVAINVGYYYHNVYKEGSSFFVGTSPEFDMAVFTLCFLTRLEKTCNLTIEEHNFSIITMSIHAPWASALGTGFIHM